MLDVLRRGQRWVIIALIMTVGLVFVFYLSGSGSGPGSASRGALIELGDRRYTERDVRRYLDAREREFRETLGDAYDPRVARDILEQSARSQLIGRAVLAYEAERLGIRASDEEIRTYVDGIPAFRNASGGFDRESLRAFARQTYGSQAAFVDEIRDELLISKFLRLLEAAAGTSEAEARDALRYRGEEAQIAYVLLDPARFARDAAVDEADIETFLTAEQEQVRNFFNANNERYHTDEQVRARHILLRIEDGASEEAVAEVRVKAEAILTRLQGGEDFADVAKAESEDPSSALRGGDLGLFGRGQMVGPFEEAAFSLEPATLSELVRTQFGFHILQVEEHNEAIDRSYDEVAKEIAEELLRKERGIERADAHAKTLSDAIEAGKTLTGAAREEGLTLERPDWISHNRNGSIEGLGIAQELLRTVFALPENRSSKEIFRVGERRVLVERTAFRSPEGEDLAAGVDGERERLLGQWRSNAQAAWIDKRREELEEAGLLITRFPDTDPS